MVCLSLIHDPEKVKQIRQEFIAAGAQIITTNSYALVPHAISELSFLNRAEKPAVRSGRISRSAADEHFATTGKVVLVAGSLGPVFGSYEPAKFGPNQIQQYLAPLVCGFSGCVDIWLGESLSVNGEADAVLGGVRDTEKEAWISFSLDPATRRLRSGESTADAARWALNNRVSALLVNCSPPEMMNESLGEVKTVLEDLGPIAKVKLGVYANAFEIEGQECADNNEIILVRVDLSAERYAEFGRQWIEMGARILVDIMGLAVNISKPLLLKSKAPASKLRNFFFGI